MQKKSSKDTKPQPSSSEEKPKNARADDLGLKANASIGDIVEASITFLAKENGTSSLIELKKYLAQEHADKIDLERHVVIIKKHLKSMFDAETIVPARANLRSRSVTVRFKLGPSEKKKISKTIMKKKAQNATKTNKKMKQTTSDDEDEKDEESEEEKGPKGIKTRRRV